MKRHAYTNPAGFRQALEVRLNKMARGQSADIQRLRRQVAFDRLLCRLIRDSGEQWILKGGYAMELRLEKSRTTRDIDLATRRPPRGAGRLSDRILRSLQAAAATDLNDFFSYAIGQPTRDLAGALYGGARYPVEARVAGRVFARFHVDVVSGDPVLEPVEQVHGQDWLAFAGLPSLPFPAISKEQQFAEKLHAYTLPRAGAANSRVRDLLDMYLLVRLGLNTRRVGEAVHAVFTRRKTHEMPDTLSPPPDNWTRPFAALAEECAVETDIHKAFHAVAAFVDRTPLT